MKKILAIIRKDGLVLWRDKIGLAILFIMPIVLIIVMTLIQDAAFHTISEKGVPLVFVDNDHDSLGISIKNGLKNSDLCTFHDKIDGKPATLESAEKAVSEGKFMIAVVIPENATKRVRESVNNLVDETMGFSDPSIQKSIDSVEITLFIDPIAKNSIIVTVTSSLHEFISAMKTKIMFETFSEQIGEIVPEGTSKPQNAYEKTQIIKYNQVFASNLVDDVVPNAVQHNVPAWTIFGMFFIVISIVSNIMREKKDGSVLRLYTLPTSYSTLIYGKIIVYVAICTLQFFAMMLVGIYIMPFLGLPALEIGDSIFGLVMLGIATAFASTGFGIVVGTLAQSEQQGAILGSLSVLLLSALGGIWVPTYVMPDAMRQISSFSPMNWALDGFYLLLFRGTGINGVIKPVILLMVFFLVMLGIALLFHRNKRSA